MRKLWVLGFALFLVAAFTLPASAIEHKFGGFTESMYAYYKNMDFSKNGINQDYDAIRSRTRLNYTAVLTDKVRFVNEFEIDFVWGQQQNYGTIWGSAGDLGTDGLAFEVRYTHMDFDVADFNFKIGAQRFVVHRGLIIGDDAAGAKVSYIGAKGLTPSLWYWRLNDGDNASPGFTNRGSDMDHVQAMVDMKFGDLQLIPSVGYLFGNAGRYNTTTGGSQFAGAGPLKIYFAGLDANWKMGGLGVELTGIYEGGKMDDAADLKIEAFALWGKASYKLGDLGIWGAALYTTGDEYTRDTNNIANVNRKYKGFWYPEQHGTGAAFVTSEMLSEGDEWSKVPNATKTGGKGPENRMEFGAGVNYQATKAINLSLSFWNLNLSKASLITTAGDKDIGNEIDLKAVINLTKHVDLRLIGAYLFIGDAFKPAVNDADYALELSAGFILKY